MFHKARVLDLCPFCAYISILAYIIPENVFFHRYADETQLYCGFKTSDYRNGVKDLEECSISVERWFLLNGMLLNAEKSDALILSTSQQARKLPADTSIRIAECDVVLSDSVRNLGVIIDNRLSFDKHVTSVCQSCCYHMKAFRHIRHCLSFETSSTIARSIVLSRIDYCNSVLYGTSKKNHKKLQHIQNSLVTIIYSLPARSTTQPFVESIPLAPNRKSALFTRMDF